MAVVSISRIQVRRGRKDSETGLPQLASGEFGWAIDTQELYIGNGSVSEGSPGVGNTKILTENDNIFDFATLYRYKADDATIVTGVDVDHPVVRSLGARLDDIVSVKSFGALGDGTLQTAALQRAIDQLYINAATKGDAISRVVLTLEAGIYLIDDTIYIPPFVTLMGAGKEKTIIRQTEELAIFKTVNETSEAGSPATFASTTTTNQARNIQIYGITLEQTTDSQIMILDNCVDSHFRNIKLKGTWTNGDGVLANSKGIELNNLSLEVTTSNNVFEDIEIEGLTYPVYSDFDIQLNHFNRMYVHDAEFGFLLGRNSTGGAGSEYGCSKNTIENSRFDLINQHAIAIEKGTKNVSRNNIFETVGFSGGNATTSPAYSVIKFTENGNISDKDSFDKTELLSYTSDTTEEYVGEVEGSSFGVHGYTHSIDVLTTSSWLTMFRLPASQTATYRVDYYYKSIGSSRNMIRQGTFTVSVNRATNEVQLVDEYDFLGASPSMSENLEFRATLDTVLNAVNIEYQNSTLSDDGTFQYQLKTIQ